MISDKIRAIGNTVAVMKTIEKKTKRKLENSREAYRTLHSIFQNFVKLFFRIEVFKSATFQADT